MMRYLIGLASLGLSAVALAAEAEPRPTLSSDGSWVPVILIVVGGMFLAAAVIGPIVRANTPEEVPPAHSHDEPPGTSHHHGASGLLNPAPENELHH
ncbi:MAG TPA: hypothetical protein VHS31_01245 [Tepidisphaeraceae bacterium]|nr:hypothetical protein [Tepidisphaeraceae bacterium]